MIADRKLTSFRLTVAVLEMISSFAEENGISRAAVIERAVRELIKRVKDQ
jgi:hypothetical protein